jgi:hypothetical protein
MTRDAIAIHEGDTIRVKPHDVWRGTDKPHHIHRAATVLVTGEPVRVGLVVVICWHATGTECGVVVYDWDAPVELVKAAAA